MALLRGKWLENVDWAHLTLASGKLELQKAQLLTPSMTRCLSHHISFLHSSSQPLVFQSSDFISCYYMLLSFIDCVTSVPPLVQAPIL